VDGDRLVSSILSLPHFARRVTIEVGSVSILALASLSIVGELVVGVCVW